MHAFATGLEIIGGVGILAVVIGAAVLWFINRMGQDGNLP